MARLQLNGRRWNSALGPIAGAIGRTPHLAQCRCRAKRACIGDAGGLEGGRSEGTSSQSVTSSALVRVQSKPFCLRRREAIATEPQMRWAIEALKIGDDKTDSNGLVLSSGVLHASLRREQRMKGFTR
eukprot:IDg22459t1